MTSYQGQDQGPDQGPDQGGGRDPGGEQPRDPVWDPLWGHGQRHDLGEGTGRGESRGRGQGSHSGSQPVRQPVPPPLPHIPQQHAPHEMPQGRPQEIPQHVPPPYPPPATGASPFPQPAARIEARRQPAGELPGAPIRLDSAAFYGDPATLYRTLRHLHGSVAPVLLDGEIPVWLVLGYREVHYVTANPGIFGRDSRRWHAWNRVPKNWPPLPYVAYRPSVVFAEGEEHRRRAGAVAEVLAGVDQFELRLAAERAADAAVDRFGGTGRAELVSQYAGQVPLRVMAGLLGLHDHETAEAAELERDMTLSLDDGPDAATAYARIHRTMELLLERGRRRPGPELPSRLLAHPAGLTDEEIVQDLITVVLAGQQPTAQWIGNTLRLMLTDNRFAVTLSGGRRSVGQALTEVLWTDTPVQNVVGRWATRDTRLGGRLIRRGDCLLLGLAAANTDPAMCPVPGATASAAHGNQAHLSFGHGEHRCPAPAPEIAEIMAKAAVEVLLDRLPDLRLAAAAGGHLGWRPSLWLRGPAALPVEFTPH